MTFKPNLAGTPTTDSDLRFPLLASPKIDGVRAMKHPHPMGIMSRSMKLIPNANVQKLLNLEDLVGLDGELVVGSATDSNCMQNTTSGVMSSSKEFTFQFHVFDKFDTPGGFSDRLAVATRIVKSVQAQWSKYRTMLRLEGAAWAEECPIVMVPHTMIVDPNTLVDYEAHMLSLGYEGVMVRDPHGAYKQGRSTVKEGGLLKLKRFVDAEFIIVGFEEQMKNNNAKTTNELGRSKRSSHAAGKSGKDTLGALVVRHIKPTEVTSPAGKKTLVTGAPGIEFNIGTGMDDDLRAHIWANRDKYMGAIGTYKSFPIGVKDAPRHPVFKAFRPEWDIS